MKIAGYILEALCWLMVVACAIAATASAFSHMLGYLVYYIFLGFIMTTFGFIMREANSMEDF